MILFGENPTMLQRTEMADSFNIVSLLVIRRILSLKVLGTLDKILPVILSDDVQDSVTPEVVLIESELDNDSGSELLVDF